MTLTERLKAAAARPMTSEELWRQRVSFVYGQLGADSTLTKPEVEAILARHEGRLTT